MTVRSHKAIATARHRPFYIAALISLVILPVAVYAKVQLAAQLTGIAFFLIYLLLIGRRLPQLSGSYLKNHATDSDAPAPIILIVTVGAFVLSLASLFIVLQEGEDVVQLDLVLSFASVILGWFTIHTMAAVHYAHVYWRPHGGKALSAQERGLDFPQTAAPGIYDFLYFAFVVGMTAQTSDVAVTTTEMRKLNLLHAIVSFFFNTVLVAAAVNAAVTLAS
ncbi:DUF1345 domain-containing protein [Sinorhizobium sp. BG8]|uniref:DUF1345 domain-containing protein n=1 Tax=Sinorhizobium sp. BG8 TaxID=2613773 RepID=UPI00193E0A76|nr:DUF1345 domain-containing protein [Sinorhizobium sp. BG8]QRM55588.1 DUF1345 domain-containing protein [Sinorhizobium sp. BG8]